MRPADSETLSIEPMSLEPKEAWGMFLSAATEGIEMVMKRLGLSKVQLVIGQFYTEEIEPGDLPTDDFLYGVRRDLSGHGKLIVTIHHGEGEWDQICVAALEKEGKPVIECIWFGETMLEKVREVAAASDPSEE